jgi:hypothetical protein
MPTIVDSHLKTFDPNLDISTPFLLPSVFNIVDFPFPQTPSRRHLRLTPTDIGRRLPVVYRLKNAAFVALPNWPPFFLL